MQNHGHCVSGFLDLWKFLSGLFCLQDDLVSLTLCLSGCPVSLSPHPPTCSCFSPSSLSPSSSQNPSSLPSDVQDKGRGRRGVLHPPPSQTKEEKKVGPSTQAHFHSPQPKTPEEESRYEGWGQRENAERGFWETGNGEVGSWAEAPPSSPFSVSAALLPAPHPHWRPTQQREKRPGAEPGMETLGGDKQTQNLIHSLAGVPASLQAPDHTARAAGGARASETEAGQLHLGVWLGAAGTPIWQRTKQA